jgi:hypothetical protein
VTDQVMYLFLNRLKEHLTARMIADVATDDPTLAKVVKIGLFQDDPTNRNVYIAIQGGNHEDPKDTDGIITGYRMQTDVGIDFPYAREIGGGQIWRRKVSVAIGCYFIRQKFSEDEATQQAYIALGRLLSSIESVNINGLVDSFDERVIEVFCHGNTFFESGGPPASYIFRGIVNVSVLTERP